MSENLDAALAAIDAGLLEHPGQSTSEPALPRVALWWCIRCGRTIGADSSPFCDTCIEALRDGFTKIIEAFKQLAEAMTPAISELTALMGSFASDVYTPVPAKRAHRRRFGRG